MKPRNSYELKLMRRSGQIAASALKKALDALKDGVTGLKLNEIAANEILRLGGDWSYQTVPGYKHATCITINDQVVHGIPTDVKIKIGDLVSIDLAVIFKGWHTDCAWTVQVEDGRWNPSTSLGAGMEDGKEKERFLRIGEEALWDGIAKAVEGNRVGDISHAIQSKVESAGYSVVRSLVGHGVGRSLHEAPEVPGYGQSGSGVRLVGGMSLALEVIYAQGGYEVVLDSDGWTYKTADGSLAGLFEMSVVVGKEKAEVLTDWRKV